MIPAVGAFINGGFDLVEITAIGNRSYCMFFESDFVSDTDISVEDIIVDYSNAEECDSSDDAQKAVCQHCNLVCVASKTSALLIRQIRKADCRFYVSVYLPFAWLNLLSLWVKNNRLGAICRTRF